MYIDVRTVEEFAAGHPEGAVNIPIAFHDPAQGMVYNHEFVEVVERHYAKDRKLLLGCKAGPRSNSAANLLEQTGYQDVASVLRRLRRHARPLADKWWWKGGPAWAFR